MLRGSLFVIILIVIVSVSLSMQGEGVKTELISETDFKKNIETTPRVVLKKVDRGISLLKHEANVSFEETCRLHHLIQRTKTDEQRATAGRDTHRGGNGINCPVETERYSTTK